MTTISVARYLLLVGLPLLSVCYIPFNLKPGEFAPTPLPKSAASSVALPTGSGFATIRQLARKQEYVAAIEQLQHIPKTNPHYERAQQIKVQYQQKAIEALGACSHGFDPKALKRSRFYQASNDQYIAQVECFPSATQPAYEYYLYNEKPSAPKVTPLNLTQFEQTYDSIAKKDSNFVTGSPAFNRQTRELTVARTYGEKGDCGTIGEYRFDRNKFVLKQFVGDFKCGDGKLHYQTIYSQDMGGAIQ